MWVASGSGVPVDPFTPSQSWINAANNRLVNAGQGIGYDAVGNQTSIGGYARTYDGENRLATSTINSVTATYSYDGDGRRVKKVQGSATTVYVYDAGGNLAAEYATQPETPLCTTCYLTADHLGSTRLMTDGTTGLPKALHDYLPFGEEIPAGIGGRSSLYGSDAPRQRFTGKERDAETGLDFMEARYYSGPQGRFTSVDPDNAGSNSRDPQSWNGYAYGRNNPLLYADPTGTNYTVCDAQGKNCRDLSNKEYDQYLQSIKGTSTYVTAGGIIKFQNADGSTTTVGSATYYDEKARAQDEAGLRLITQGAGPVVNGLGYATLGVMAGAGAAAAYGAYAGGTAIYSLGIAAGPLLPAVPGALMKLQRLGITLEQAREIVQSPASQRLIDNLNSSNINVIQNVGDKVVRITLDPSGQRIISAGLMRANQVTNGIASGRFTPMK